MNSIAACLIVRDEENSLRTCLASVEGQVDAIYITDTGSKDATLEVAASHKANVRFFPWVDDFAAARNASLEGISEDWVLMLDADDYFAAGEMAKLRPQLDPKASAATVRYTVVSHYTPVRAIRLLRNGQGATYRGRIHENLDDWIAERRAAGGSLQDLDVELTHTGYAPEAMPAKVARNLALLRSEWQAGFAPGAAERKYYIGAELGLALAHSGQFEEAHGFLETLLQEVNDSESEYLPPAALRVLVNLLWTLAMAGRNAARLPTIQAVEGRFAHSRVYQLHRGLVELEFQYFTAARLWLENFREALGKKEIEIPVPVQYTRAGLWRALGLCHMGEQDFPAAAACFERCRDMEPDVEEHQLRLLVAKRMMNP